jgi:hypothetical protein
MKHIITEVDLLRNPDLVVWGLKAGDEIEIPNQTTTNADDTGGSNPPPDKERPDKP